MCVCVCVCVYRTHRTHLLSDQTDGSQFTRGPHAALGPLGTVLPPGAWDAQLALLPWKRTDTGVRRKPGLQARDSVAARHSGMCTVQCFIYFSIVLI